MEYHELPLSERMQKAKEFALILSGDEAPLESIINELCFMFNLTEEQANQAYINMRSEYSREYQKRQNRKLRDAFVAFLVIAMLFSFYALLFLEIVWLFYVAVFLLILLLIGIIYTFLYAYLEKKISPWALLKLKAKNRDELISKTGASIPIAIFFLASFSFILAYFEKGIIKTTKLSVVNGLVVTGSVSEVKTKGKNSKHYFEISIGGYYPTEFRLDRDIFKYGKWQFSKYELKAGDTVDIHIWKEDTSVFRGGNRPSYIQLKNIRNRSGWLVDHTVRNSKVKKENWNLFYIFSGIFILSLLLWFFYIRNKWFSKD